MALNTKDIYKRLNEVFQDVFDDDSIRVTPDTTADDIEDWDSMEHINLIGAVENEFGLRFKMGEVSGMKNVGEMASIIAKRGTK
ncbi:acyl carrier protein [Ruminococcus sp. YE71]|nr:acyl carrier protein [Ruminococcus sp. YE78]SFW38810.1 acyl carrier protein [Ruminococcus sp. YE71]